MPSGRLARLLVPIVALVGCGGVDTAGGPIRVSDVTLFGDLDCFKVETPSATYLYGKKGAGFASILDPDGRDWISYHPGDKAAGEYRGLPKCGQPTKYFHAGYGFGSYKTDDPFTSRVVGLDPDHVRIESRTKDGKCSCAWDFFKSSARLTLERINLPKFWFLYEGTPGGALDPEHDVAIRPTGQRTPLAEPWEDADVPWACIASPKSPYGLLLVSHDQHTRAATYVAWPYKPEPDGGFRQMTVFGWGRLGWKDAHQHEPQISELPAHFSVALVRDPDDRSLRKAVEGMSVR